MQSLNDIRAAFLAFFEGKGHTALPSAPLVPHHDPTLMFTNAGMAPFKNVFSGAETLKNRDGSPIQRATTSQKCVRAGGKHNDLENVGYTARHHTFFEMLGNFSFADYFKEEAIEYAWELLTKTFALPPEKLLITVYHTDDEAFDLWKKITGFPDEKIIRIPTSDNFWAMGDTGPCGPCSEIFYDHGSQIPGGPPGSPEEDGDRFIEIWNLVFMQHEKHADGTQTDLPRPCIDTGMGLERMAAVLQGVHDNYEIDLFQHLLEASRDISGNAAPTMETSHRVIADHLRSCAFLLADGVMPSNEGRGYVLRRIMRRGMRHAHLLGCKEPLMHRLVPSLLAEMGRAYGELNRAEGLITETLKQEETRFQETLGRGLKLLEEESAPLREGESLPGDVAFKLYDTYGFPLDLTEDILRGKNMQVDHTGFDAAMEEQRERARASWSGSGDTADASLWFDLKEQHGATEFTGYTAQEGTAEIIAIVKDGKAVDSAIKGDTVSILTNQTPFYAESGGQAGDQGSITAPDGLEITITDTKKPLGALHVHQGNITSGGVSVGDVVSLRVDETRRDAIRANHSATHLLHAALREILGDHVTQKGSLVEAEYFRFDFSHNSRVEPEELAQIEQRVNAIIRQNTDVSTRLMTPEDAIEAGAMALFGEKYGDEVRVLSMGENAHQPFSVELCGGTHVARTGDIGLLKITRESAVASGIRRIEAVTAAGAETYVSQEEARLNALCGLLKSTPEEAEARLSALLEERKNLERDLKQTKQKLAMGGGGGTSATDAPEEINGTKFLGKVMEGVSPKDLRGIVDGLKQQIGSGVVCIVAVNDDKAAIVVGVTDDATSAHDAVTLVRAGSEALGGKGGGGRSDFAQAGGPNVGATQAAIDAVRAAI